MGQEHTPVTNQNLNYWFLLKCLICNNQHDHGDVILVNHKYWHVDDTSFYRLFRISKEYKQYQILFAHLKCITYLYSVTVHSLQHSHLSQSSSLIIEPELLEQFMFLIISTTSPVFLPQYCNDCRILFVWNISPFIHPQSVYVCNDAMDTVKMFLRSHSRIVVGFHHTLLRGDNSLHFLSLIYISLIAIAQV